MHVTSSILLGIKFRVEHLEPDETGRRFVSLDISIFLALFWMVLWPPHYSSGPPSNVGGKDHGSSFAIIKLTLVHTHEEAQIIGWMEAIQSLMKLICEARRSDCLMP